jgi:Zn-dependent peptidase ImmA (M78 family)/transcriptional regulator with XRE-family HTH domain
VAAFFDGRRLMLARHLAGLRKNALADLIGRTPTAVAAYENGTKRPAPATVGQLALALGVEPSFFMAGPRDLDDVLGLPHFRSLRATTQRARDQAYAYGLMAFEVAASLERHVEFPARDLPSAPVPVEELGGNGPEQAARHLREHWQLSPGPAGPLVRLAESHGVLVVFSPMQAVSVDAYSFDTPNRPVIILNPAKQDYFRQRFDVAHELGHLIMHSDAEPGGRSVEDQANRFAAELLLPEGEITDHLPRRADWPALNRLKEQWGVSLQALLFRARRLGRMSDSTYRNSMTMFSAKGWRRREPGPMPAIEQPSLLPKAVELLGQAGFDGTALARECRAPHHLFTQITARTPGPGTYGEQVALVEADLPDDVVSILSAPSRHFVER